jgi:hypothetical protein
VAAAGVAGVHGVAAAGGRPHQPLEPRLCRRAHAVVVGRERRGQRRVGGGAAAAAASAAAARASTPTANVAGVAAQLQKSVYRRVHAPRARPQQRLCGGPCLPGHAAHGAHARSEVGRRSAHIATNAEHTRALQTAIGRTAEQARVQEF